MKTVKVQKDEKTGDHYLKLEDFVGMVDIKKVKYYTLEIIDDEYDKCMLVKFYDKNKKVINCKETK